jgi:ABC-type transport system involved in multi-copper enzyme maturation permease subunit
MKFLAILKDSLRETLDVKLFYVLVGLSLLVVLFVGSITYKPEPIETQLKPLVGIVGKAISAEFQEHQATRRLNADPEISDVVRVDPAREPWETDHRFKLTLTLTSKRPKGIFGHAHDDGDAPPPDADKEGELIAAGKQVLKTERVQKFLKEFIFFVDNVEVEPVPSAESDKVVYEVTMHGTKIKSRKEWFHKPALFFGLVEVPIPLMPLAAIVVIIGDYVVGTFGTAIIMFLSTIMTASFLPSMLAKGTVDLLLVKPVFRSTLFVYKFLGGLLFMFLNTAVIMGGIWLALGLQTGLWINAFLLCILIYTFQFTVFYSVSALAAVLTRSAIVAILVAVMLWVALFAIGWSQWIFIERIRDKDPPREGIGYYAYVGFDVFHAMLPHYKELDWLTSRLILEELAIKTRDTEADREKAIEELDKKYGAYHWGSSLAVSGAFIVVIVGLACLRFAFKDY